jgi:hypothetical protein
MDYEEPNMGFPHEHRLSTPQLYCLPTVGLRMHLGRMTQNRTSHPHDFGSFPTMISAHRRRVAVGKLPK